jgi:hypothetical protein
VGYNRIFGGFPRGWRLHHNTRNLPGGKGRTAHKTDNLNAICKPIIYKMWEPLRLTTLWTSTACYRDSFTFFTISFIYRRREAWNVEKTKSNIVNITQPTWRSRNSAVCITTGYRLEGQEVGVRVPVEARIFPFHLVETGSGAQPASHPTGIGVSFPRGHAARAWSWPLNLQLMPKSKIMWTYPLLP